MYNEKPIPNKIMNKKIGNNPLGELVKIIKEIWLGFKIAEQNRDKSQWGKF